jgi:dolichol kinase
MRGRELLTSRSESEGRTASGCLDGNLLLKTCFQRRSCGPAERDQVLSPRPISTKNIYITVFCLWIDIHSRKNRFISFLIFWATIIVMLFILFSLAFIFILLVLSSFLWNKNYVRLEVARKSVHIVVGTFIAFWPFYMSFEIIQWLSLAMLVVVLASKYWSLFPSIHSVARNTWGEVLWIFMAAVLHMSLADGLAAVVGTTFGKKNGYKILGQHKSLIGTFTFGIVSMGITSAVVVNSDIAVTDITLPLLLMLPVAASLAENLSPYGSDNLWVPLLVVYFLNYAALLS